MNAQIATGLIIFVFGLFLGALGGIAGGLYHVNGDAKDLPAWLQAGGALVALVVAIFVPWFQQHLNKLSADEEKEVQARSLAILTYPLLLGLRGHLISLLALMEKHQEEGGQWAGGEEF